jgi:hypothetical protein
MNLYEVIYWGSHGDGNAKDTIYLVRASDFRAAVEHVQWNISASDHNGESGILADVVYEIGVDSSPSAASNHPCTLRGPYFAFAYNSGWKSWKRKMTGSKYTNEWMEDTDVAVS